MPELGNRKKIFDIRKHQKKLLAATQINDLLWKALDENRVQSDLAERYASIAWNLSTRFNVRLRDKRMFFCHNCKEFIIPPELARIRLSKKRKSLNLTCLRCQYTYRKIIAQ